MNTTKYFAMAAAALMMASCSSDEIDRVVPQTAGDLLPLEMVPDVANQTRAAQITADNLTAFTVDVTGTFKTADGEDVVNPVLALTKSGDTWSYTYKVGDAAPVNAQLYWPVEPETTTFSAHTAADGASIDEKTTQTDIVGDYRTVDFDGTSATSTVALTMRHAVSKMEFKARVQAPATAGTDISIDIKQVAVRNVKYTGTYAKPAVAENGGVITATGEAGNLFTETRTESSFITKSATAATTLGSLFMVPQTEIAASAFSTPATPGAYLSVLAQIRVTQGELTTVTFPEAGTIDAAGTKYAWIAVPLPEEFTQMQAHHKYIFTLNFSTDALGHTDIVQDEPSDITPAPEEFETVEVKGRSGNAVSVSVETVYDFDEEVTEEVEVNEPAFGTDLSMLDCAGNARADGRWTANCYMVHTAGDYKLPLVYGNAIKAGETNAAAYTGVTGNSKATATFPRHDGQAITAPWIKDNGITVTTAELLWQDAKGLVTAVGISGEYLTLTVGKDATTQEGNAVVAAKDADGNIVWSWHIWVTKQTFAAADLTTVATGSHNYTVTPVNLGWVSTSADGKKGYSTFYQWGRKDAVKGTGAPANANVYDISGATVTGLTYTKSTTATIADNIKNPTTFYYVGSGRPSTATYFNLWDAQQTGSDNITTATKKTVYDPSPAGFCVPTGNLYYYFSNGSSRSLSTWDSTNKGATWNLGITANALFFPASGYRNVDDGSLSEVGSTGYYWAASATSSSTNHARTLYFYSSNWCLNNNLRSDGFPVRAVAEE